MTGLRWSKNSIRSRSGKKRGWGPVCALIALRNKAGYTPREGVYPAINDTTLSENPSPAKPSCLSLSLLLKSLAVFLAFTLFTSYHLHAQVVEIDVACAYSPTAVARAGGEENLQLQFATALLTANSIYENSRTEVRFRVCGFYKSSLDPIDLNSADVLDLLSWYSGFNDVRTFAASNGADLVAYIAKTTGYSAVAELPGQYSVYSDQAIWYTVLAHELAHNFGATHEDGLQFTGTNGLQYTTVMLMGYCGGTTIPYFTSSNLQFMGITLLGNTKSNCGMGSLVNGGENARKIAITAQSVYARRNRALPPPPIANGLTYRWSFNCTLGPLAPGTITLDSVSGVPAIIRGQGAVATGRGLYLPGFSTGNVAGDSISAYLDLPNKIISAFSNLTIEIWVNPVTARPGQRLFSFGRTTELGNAEPGEWVSSSEAPAPGLTTPAQEIALCLSTNTDLSRITFSVTHSNVTRNLNMLCDTPKGQTYQYVVTYEAGVGQWANNGGRFTIYRNGTPLGYLDVDFKLQDIQDVNNWIGRAQASSNYNAAIEVEEIRIYNRAISPAEVLSSWLAGPDALQPTTPYTSSELIADLRAADFNGLLWSNRTGKGDFIPTGKPVLVLNVSNTGIPGIYFNGSSDGFVGPIPPTSLLGDAPRTIEVWVYNPNLNTEETLVSWGERKSLRFNCAFNFGSSTSCGAATHGGDDVAWGGTPPKAGSWQYLVYIYSNQWVRIYVDGILRWQWKLNGPLSTTNKPINIGCQRNSNGTLSQFFSGFINSIRIHAGVLTPEQIAGNFLAGPIRNTPTIQTTLNPTPLISAVAGIPIRIQPGYTLPAWVTNSISYTLLNAPQGVSIDPETGLITWHPTIAQAGSTYYFAVSAITTNGTSLSATQWLAVTVCAPPQPRINRISFENGIAAIEIDAIPGIKYTIQASQNLTHWEDILRITPNSTPIRVTDTNAAKYNVRFYRILVGPYNP